MATVQVFIYLQFLDFLTTMIGLRSGAGELSPFTRWLMAMGPAAGVMASKVIALFLVGLCVWRGRTRVVNWANYYFAGLVIWNLFVILRLPA